MKAGPRHCAFRRGAAGVIALLALGLGNAAASPERDNLAQLANMSLEELMQAPVVTVAGTPVSRISTPAALTVITADEIRRSGHRTIAEALRMVPGMFVGRINSSSWVIGARGLTGTALTATRYLVLIDGRLVYDPLISVTFWDAVDVVLADVDRIEVVRGPGATLWGVNAMNGVVNIITKRASDTLGTLVQVGAGSNGEQNVTLRYGAPVDADSAFRVWGQYASHGDFEDSAGASLHDQWSSAHAGFRYDGALTPQTRYTVQGDAYTHPTAMASVRLPVPGEDQQFEQATGNDTVQGANVLFRAIQGQENTDGWMLRAYYDQTRRDTSRFGVSRDTADVEYRRWLPWGARNKFIWGVQYDWTRDDVTAGPSLILDPAARSWDTTNAFVQNTTELVDHKLFLMLGTKFTESSFVGFQTQPSARLWWTPSETQTLWAAVSRPVRVPSRFEEDGLLVFSYIDSGVAAGKAPTGVIVPLGLAGDEDLRPEKLLAYELGHRIQISDRWVFDTALFYNDYRRLIGVPPTIFGTFTDAASGRTYGVDFSVSAHVNDRWRLEGSWSRMETHINGPVLHFEENSTPNTLAQLRSYFDVADNVELNAALYRVGKIPGLGIDAYTRADLGVSWRVRKDIELSLWGQNLFDAGHSEESAGQVPRSVYAQVSFAFGR